MKVQVALGRGDQQVCRCYSSCRVPPWEPPITNTPLTWAAPAPAPAGLILIRLKATALFSHPAPPSPYSGTLVSHVLLIDCERIFCAVTHHRKNGGDYGEDNE
ncbi:hypothetical protein J6590_023603 [Homalodisca vitripennis]|nr:hypothetical protein J6590_023603 [Homalodisca vitripennis]